MRVGELTNWLSSLRVLRMNPAGAAIVHPMSGLNIETLARRTAELRLATFGDSTAAIGAPSVPDTQDFSVLTAPFPASGNANSVNPASNKWSLPMLYQNAYVVFNGGIGGQTTQQMLDRDALAASTTRRAITDLINSKPDLAILRGGSINDLLAVTPATVDATVATVYAKHVTIINRILSAGIPVIDEGIYGYSGVAVTDPDATRTALMQLNALFDTYAASRFPNVRYINWTGVLRDASGNYLADMAYDGLHLSQWGQYVAAAKEAEVVSSMFGVASGSRFKGANLISNALMYNTTAQSYGTQATGFTLGASNAVRQNAKVEVIDGKVWQTVEIVPTAIDNYGSIYAPFTPATWGIVANDVYGFELDFMLTGLDGGDPPALMKMFSSRVELYKVGAGRVIVDALVPNVPAYVPGVYKGKAIFGPLQITEPSANIAATSAFYLRIGGASMTPYKIGLSFPNAVKL